VSELSRRLVHVSGTAIPGAYVVGIVDWATLRWALLAAALAVVVVETVRLFAGLDWRVFRALVREYEHDNVAAYALFAWSTTLVAWLFAPPVAVPGMLMLSVGDPVAGVLGRRVGRDEGPTAGAGDVTSTAGAAGDGQAVDEAAADDAATDDAATDSDHESTSTTVAVDSTVASPELASRTKPPVVLAATFAVCFALAWPFTTGAAGAVVGGVAAAVGAAGATLADGVKPVVAGYVVDDNLSIPPAACTGIWLVFQLAGG